MDRRVIAAVLAAAVSPVLATGCGSSGSETTRANPSQNPSQNQSQSVPTPLPPGGNTTGIRTPGGSGGFANPAATRQQAIAACKSSIAAQSTLPANVKSQLTAVCNTAGSGNQSAARQAAAQACQSVVRSTVPASAQAQALANCPKP
jgi:hypothetical protein